MGGIVLKELDFERVRNWLKRAQDKQRDDAVHCFISVWIGFNYYFSTFASANQDEFKAWRKRHSVGHEGSKAQWSFLIGHDDFKAFFSSYRSQNVTAFQAKVRLPVMNMLTDKGVPKGLKGECGLNELTDEQIFSVIYQIRNNLFHGSKDPPKKKRDMELSEVAAKFMVPFLTELINNTSGEVMSIYKSSG